MSKRVLTHSDHLAIIAELKAYAHEAEHSVCVRLAARFGVGKGRVYEIRHGIHTPPCCGGSPRAAKAAEAGDGQPIIGFRMWQAVGLKLASYSQLGSRPWTPGETYKADCSKREHGVLSSSEPVPSKANCCGVHAYKSKRSADILAACAANGVLGAVVMTGTVREASLGYRAQFARLLCFSIAPLPLSLQTNANLKRKHEDRTAVVEGLAAEYGVPLIPYEHLELYVSEFGRLIPEKKRK